MLAVGGGGAGLQNSPRAVYYLGLTAGPELRLGRVRKEGHVSNPMSFERCPAPNSLTYINECYTKSFIARSYYKNIGVRLN